MKIAAAIVLWLAVSPLFAWLAGRFIRVGMVELQPEEAQP
jgi:hypothetical protein